MQAGPVWHQLLGKRRPDALMTWRMYFGAAADYCLPELTADRDGETRAVNRFRALGYRPWYTSPRRVRRPKDVAEVERLARDICDELPVDEELFIQPKCATVKGWKQGPRRSVCTGAHIPLPGGAEPRRRERTKGKRRGRRR